MRHHPRTIALFSSALILIIAGAGDPYTSKPGNFRAAFPSAPKTAKLNTTGPNGAKVTAHSYSAKDKNGAIYSVNYAEYPAPTEAMLDAAVDSMIRSARMTPTSRESIELDGHPGREVAFEVDPPRGAREKGTGRARAVLVGKRIYQVLVIGPKSKLSDQATKAFVESFALIAPVAPVAGGDAPVEKGAPNPGPAPAEAKPAVLVNRVDRPIPVDPDGDCKIAPVREGATIVVPGKAHDLSPVGPLFNAPRLLREVSGDFVTEARVLYIDPERQATKPGGGPYRGSGLLFWQDKDHYVRLERAANVIGGQPRAYVFFTKVENGMETLLGGNDLGGTSVTMKMERKGDRILGSISFDDGRRWEELRPMDIAGWGPNGQVGLLAVNNTAKPMAAQFEVVKLRAAAR